MTELIEVAGGMWLFAYMLFWANPLNDPTSPNSTMCHYHRDNIIGRAVIDASIEEDKRAGRWPGIVLYWPEIWPYICPTLTTLIGLIAWESIRHLAVMQ